LLGLFGREGDGLLELGVDFFDLVDVLLLLFDFLTFFALKLLLGFINSLAGSLLTAAIALGIFFIFVRRDVNDAFSVFLVQVQVCQAERLEVVETLLLPESLADSDSYLLRYGETLL